MASPSNFPGYAGQCGAFLLANPGAPQCGTIWMQSQSYKVFMYPDIDPNSRFAIRTVYPDHVKCKYRDIDAEQQRVPSQVMETYSLHAAQTLLVDTTLQKFLIDLYSPNYHHWWDLVWYVNGNEWVGKNDTLESLLQLDALQQTWFPMAPETVCISFRKRTAASVALLGTIHCLPNRNKQTKPVHAIMADAMKLPTAYEQMDVQGQLEQWIKDPLHAIHINMIANWPWSFQFVQTFWRWWNLMKTFDDMDRVILLIKAILHYGPKFVHDTVWQCIVAMPFPVMQMLLDLCPAVYLKLPEHYQDNINIVRNLLLHNGHMWPLIPDHMKSNTGLMLLAIQSSPNMYQSVLSQQVNRRAHLVHHPIITNTISHDDLDWAPFVQQQREAVQNAERPFRD